VAKGGHQHLFHRARSTHSCTQCTRHTHICAHTQPPQGLPFHHLGLHSLDMRLASSHSVSSLMRWLAEPLGSPGNPQPGPEAASSIEPQARTPQLSPYCPQIQHCQPLRARGHLGQILCEENKKPLLPAMQGPTTALSPHLLQTVSVALTSCLSRVLVSTPEWLLFPHCLLVAYT
jgi:hypothetical protein